MELESDGISSEARTERAKRAEDAVVAGVAGRAGRADGAGERVGGGGGERGGLIREPDYGTCLISIRLFLFYPIFYLSSQIQKTWVKSKNN
jgi:hypothetical protein